MVVNEQWDKILEDEYDKDYFKQLVVFIKNEYTTK
jgi:uracil DNA glycosylase